MAGTRTAPDVTAAATAKQLVFKWIDISGDKISESWYIPVAATQAQIEAFADAKQAASQASLYSIEVQNIFGSVEDASNAEEGEKSASVFDVLSITLKNNNPEIASKRVQIQAPEGEMFVGAVGEKKDDIDPTNAVLIAVMTTGLAMFGAGWSVVWGRYVEHKEINEKVNI
jgi:hypothetical protein